MSRNTLYLVPLNGLCNRMRAIASARALAAASDAKLVVVWVVHSDVGSRYDELFVPDDSFEVLNIDPRNSRRDALTYLLYGEQKRVKGIPAGWITRHYFRNRILRQVRPDSFDVHELEQYVRATKKTLITSWWSFYGKPEPDFSFFVLHRSEQAEVDRISQDFSSHTIGVHIRRSDNANAIRYSPTRVFIAAMNNCIDRDPDASFFLTTDCSDTEQQIRSLFGGRVITRAREISRDCSLGMRDALVDLFVLSRTSHILGSYYSTFSETAASIGGIRWVTVTDDKSLVGKCNSDVLLLQ